MMRNSAVKRAIFAIGLAALLLAPSSALAQTSNKTFVRTLFFQDIVDPQEDPVKVRQDAAGSADAIAKFVGVTLSTAPVASSSAGFTFVRDKTTGERSLKSMSFGPTFAERPLTNGRGVFNIGFNYQYGRTEFAGGFDTADQRTIGLPIFDNTATFTDNGFVQFITKRAFLEAESHTFNVLAAYGVTDQFDVGILVPVVSLSLTGRTEEDFDLTRTWTPANNPPYQGPVGTLLVTPAVTQSAKGIGDLTARMKYSWTGDRSDGAAVTADLRLPTGNEDDLIGTGKASLKMQVLFLKSGLGPTSVHANAGYTVGGLSNEINYVVGADASRGQMTASVSFLGRTLLDGALPSRVNTVSRTFPNVNIIVDRFIWSEETLTLLQVAAGIKYHLGGQWLIDASVLIPVNQRGFQPGISPMIALERTWSRAR
jgi:hypothetical protein